MRASGVFNETTSVLMHVTEIFVMGYIPIELCYECLCVLSSDLTETPPPLSMPVGGGHNRSRSENLDGAGKQSSITSSVCS